MTEILEHTLMITGFVAVMMLVVEYLNVLTRGAWQTVLTRHRSLRYLAGALLGVFPGCLGAYIAVTVYSHGLFSVGAVVTTMIATSGDEAFVMLTLMPEKALLLMVGLAVLGIAVGVVTDLVLKRFRPVRIPIDHSFDLHSEDLAIGAPTFSQVLNAWKHCSPVRGVLVLGLLLFALGLILGHIGHFHWGWVRVSLLAVSMLALWISATVPDHFLEEHLWRHVVVKHVPKIAGWTLGALILTHLTTGYFQIEGGQVESAWLLLLMACLMGLIPESGPHLVFTMLFVQGTIPFSVLVANSIVQDGHGMLPLLAHSRISFVGVKLINFLVGLLVGGLMMGMGW